MSPQDPAALEVFLNGVAYDPVTGRIFLPLASADADPLIHVFTLRLPQTP